MSAPFGKGSDRSEFDTATTHSRCQGEGDNSSLRIDGDAGHILGEGVVCCPSRPLVWAVRLDRSLVLVCPGVGAVERSQIRVAPVRDAQWTGQTRFAGRPTPPVTDHRPQRECDRVSSRLESRSGHCGIGSRIDLDDVEMRDAHGQVFQLADDLLEAFLTVITAMPPASVSALVSRRRRQDAYRCGGRAMFNAQLDTPHFE